MQYKKLQGGQIHKVQYHYRRAIQLLQFVKGLWATGFCLAGRRLPTLV